MKNSILLALTAAILGSLAAPASAQSAYASLNFSSGQVVASGVESYSQNTCKIEDRYDDTHHLYLFAGDTFSFTMNFSEAPGNVSLKIKHLSSADGSTGQAGKTPVSLYVNGQQATSWESLSAGYEVSEIRITGLSAGQNTFELRYANDGGTTGYWVKFIQLYIY